MSSQPFREGHGRGAQALKCRALALLRLELLRLPGYGTSGAGPSTCSHRPGLCRVPPGALQSTFGSIGPTGSGRVAVQAARVQELFSKPWKSAATLPFEGSAWGERRGRRVAGCRLVVARGLRSLRIQDGALWSRDRRNPELSPKDCPHDAKN